MAGKITGLEVQQRNHERVNVYLDNDFAFGLSLMLAAELRKGQYLTDAEIAAFKAHDEGEVAYERAVRYLGTRPRSINEIRRHLGGRKPGDKPEDKLAPAVIDEVIERLQRLGYVDDLAFARYWVSQRQGADPRGLRALRYELREKGVGTDVIDEALAEVSDDDAAYRAAAKKARSFRNLDEKAFRTKLGSFLARRGFDYSVVSDVLNRLLSERRDAGDTDELTAFSDEENQHDHQE